MKIGCQQLQLLTYIPFQDIHNELVKLKLREVCDSQTQIATIQFYAEIHSSHAILIGSLNSYIYYFYKFQVVA